MTKDELTKLDDRGIAAWNQHDPKAFVDLLPSKFVWHDWSLPEPITTREKGIEFVKSWLTAFPDMKTTRVSRIVGDDSIAAELQFTGTNTGPLAMGGKTLPATNKKVTARGAYMVRAKDGKVVEFRSFNDTAGLMMQLGMMPGM